MVLRARGEREREVEPAPRLRGCRDALGRVLELVELPAPVLDRPAHGPRARRRFDRARRILRIGAVAVLQIDGDGQARRGVEHAHVLDDLVERDAAVPPPERERETGARGRQRLEPERLEHLRRPGVPGVGDDERLTLVEGPERGGLLLLGRRHGCAMVTRAGARCHFTTLGVWSSRRCATASGAAPP